MREGLRLLEQREQEDRAKIEWLRPAAKEGFDAIERGEYTALGAGGFARMIGIYDLRQATSTLPEISARNESLFIGKFRS